MASLEVTRVLEKEELYRSSFQFGGYDFAKAEGTYDVTVMEKAYNAKRGISVYCLTDDGQKIILTVWKDSRPNGGRDYMPLRSDLDVNKLPLGAHLRVYVGAGKHTGHYLWITGEYID